MSDTLIKYKYFIFLSLFIYLEISAQGFTSDVKTFSPLTKKVFSFSKLDFITSEGDFNESICTLSIKDLKSESPPFVAIYYRREGSKWFTESLYRKRLRFNFKDGIIKLDPSNFWDWFEIEEIKVVVIY